MNSPLSEDVPLKQPPAKVRDDPTLPIYVPGQVCGLVSIDSKGPRGFWGQISWYIKQIVNFRQNWGFALYKQNQLLLHRL